jgi:hypothetical protein
LKTATFADVALTYPVKIEIFGDDFFDKNGPQGEQPAQAARSV